MTSDSMGVEAYPICQASCSTLSALASSNGTDLASVGYRTRLTSTTQPSNSYSEIFSAIGYDCSVDSDLTPLYFGGNELECDSDDYTIKFKEYCYHGETSIIVYATSGSDSDGAQHISSKFLVNREYLEAHSYDLSENCSVWS